MIVADRLRHVTNSGQMAFKVRTVVIRLNRSERPLPALTAFSSCQPTLPLHLSRPAGVVGLRVGVELVDGLGDDPRPGQHW